MRPRARGTLMQRFQRERRRLVLSQSEAATYCQVPTRTLQGWELGKGQGSVYAHRTVELLEAATDPA